MGIELGLGVVLIAAAVFFFAVRTEEYKLLGKWIFLFTLLVTSAEFYIYNNTDTIILAYVIGIIAIFVVVLAVDAVLLIPRFWAITKALLKR
ncbi:MAG: hypothetical protein KGH64_00810 [Candidatus Micrarchaeota archaeon]|nr:hypothetical protein [Candidatus Micrarchaeota archaeon]